jgi:uroporphyrinogen-III synthase
VSSTSEHSSRPLDGWRVVVTRPRSQASDLDRLLEELGATVIPFPTIEIMDPPSFGPLDGALRAVAGGTYEWVVFLSVNAVHQAMTRLEAMSLKPAAIARSRVAAVGRATSDALTAAGVEPDLVPEISSAAGVASALGSGTGIVLAPRAAGAPPEAMDAMRAAGWQVDEVVAYETVPATSSKGLEVVREGQFEAVTFSSGSTVRGFSALISPTEAGLSPEDSGAAKIVCIGPSTAKIAVQLGFRVDAVASEQSAQGLSQAVLDLREVAASARQSGNGTIDR